MLLQMLLGSDPKVPPAEENLEALCQFLSTVGKQLEESVKSKKAIDAYFIQLKDVCSNFRLAPRIKFMIQNVLDMRANTWVPRREEVCAGCAGCIFFM
jgi:translation initiation factor 4G